LRESWIWRSPDLLVTSPKEPLVGFVLAPFQFGWSPTSRRATAGSIPRWGGASTSSRCSSRSSTS